MTENGTAGLPEGPALSVVEGAAADRPLAPTEMGCWVTVKSVLLAALLVAALAYWLPTWILFRHSVGNRGGYLPMFALGTFILLLLLGPVLRRVGLVFSSGEKLFVFAALAVALFCFRASALIVTLVPSPYYYATTENDFEKAFLHAVPAHLVPIDPRDPKWPPPRQSEEEGAGPTDSAGTAAPDLSEDRAPGGTSSPAGRETEPQEDIPQISWFYRGLPERVSAEAEEDWSLAEGDLPLEPIPWGLWVGPLFWWLSLFAAVWFAQLALAAILRRQWLEYETLMIPQAEVPLALVEGSTGTSSWPRIFRHRGFWIGAGVAVAIFTLEGFHAYFPAVPSLKLRALTLAPYLTEAPWSVMLPQLTIEPYLVGIAYLLPAQLSLSLWFFAVVDNLIRVLLTATGQEPMVIEAWTGALNGGSDAVGAVVVFVGVLLWSARRHLWAVVRKALWNDRDVDDTGEFLSYRTAFFGLLIAVGYIIFWAQHAGMSLAVTLFLFAFFAIIVIFISRVVLECGLVTAGLGYLVPHDRVVHLMGYKPWMLQSFTVNSFIWPTLMIEMQPMPLYLTAARVTGSRDVEGGSRRRWVLGVAFLLLLAAAVIIALRTVQVSYLRGGLSGPAGYYNETIWIFNNRLVRDVIIKDRAHFPDPVHITAMVGGGAIMAFLLLMRQLFYWWPFHPIGYVAAGLWSGVWFSFLIGWSIKRFVLRYGGGALFHQATPVFVGLVTGQFFMGVVWFIVGLIHGEVSFGAV